MTLKEQLENIVEDSTKKHEQKKREEEKSLIRSDEDWKLINEDLEHLVKELAKEGDIVEISIIDDILLYGKYISINCRDLANLEFTRLINPIGVFDLSEFKLFNLKEKGIELKITHKDIQRFCKQHEFKLRYCRVEGQYPLYRYVVSRKYNENTVEYLIKIS